MPSPTCDKRYRCSRSGRGVGCAFLGRTQPGLWSPRPEEEPTRHVAMRTASQSLPKGMGEPDAAWGHLLTTQVEMPPRESPVVVGSTW